VTIVPLGYRASVTEPACRNLGRLIVSYADGGGRPMNNGESCRVHTRVRIESAGAAGLKVYDNREVAAVCGD
jgi:hypothetical protein